MPHFVPEENLATANSLSLVASYGTFPLGRRDHGRARGGRRLARRVPGAAVAQGATLRSRRSGSTRSPTSSRRSSCFGLPIPRRREAWGPEVRVDVDVLRRSRTGSRSSGPTASRGAVIVGLGGGVIGAGAMVPLSTVFATEVLGSKSEYGVLLFALGTGGAIGVFSLLAFQKRLPRDTVFEWSIIGAGISLDRRGRVQRRRSRRGDDRGRRRVRGWLPTSPVSRSSRRR